MGDTKSEIVVYQDADQGGLVNRGEPVTARNAPAIVKAAGRSAEFAWEEFFQAEIANAHTRKNYLHAVQRFLAWVEGRGLELPRITPGDVGAYIQGMDLSVPTKKLHLAALRRFFDRLVNRHACIINPAATVKAERYAVVEGKTPQLGVKQARTLLESIDVSNMVGLRDRAVLAVLAYTAARVGAVAKLTLKSLKHDGTQYSLRFSEKGGKSRRSRCGTTWRGICWSILRLPRSLRAPLPHGVPQDEDFHEERDDRDRHLPHDEAAAEGCGIARPFLAALVPRDDGDRSLGAERAAGGHAVPGGAFRPADHANLRPAAA